MLRAQIRSWKIKENAKFIKRKRFEEIKHNKIKLLDKNYRDAFVFTFYRRLNCPYNYNRAGSLSLLTVA